MEGRILVNEPCIERPLCKVRWIMRNGEKILQDSYEIRSNEGFSIEWRDVEVVEE